MPRREQVLWNLPILSAKGIGRRIVKRRKALGWDRERLCRATGIRRGTLSAYETGHRIPMRDPLLALAIALDVAVEYLAYDEGEPGEPDHARVVAPDTETRSGGN